MKLSVTPDIWWSQKMKGIPYIWNWGWWILEMAGAVFLMNNCKFKGCGQLFATLGDLIQHIEETHIGTQNFNLMSDVWRSLDGPKNGGNFWQIAVSRPNDVINWWEILAAEAEPDQILSVALWFSTILLAVSCLCFMFCNLLASSFNLAIVN